MGKLPKVPQGWLDGAQENAPEKGAPGGERAPADSIDWDFVLGGSEGEASTKGYIPRVDDTSGLTVGHGVDPGRYRLPDWVYRNPPQFCAWPILEQHCQR
jgi:hypothetical protein